MLNSLKLFKKNILFYLATILVVLAQIPFLKENVFSKVLSFSSIILLFLNLIIKRDNINFKNIVWICIIFMSISLYICLSILLYNEKYFSDTFYCILISFSIFIMCYLNYQNSYNKINIDFLISIMIYSIFILSITIYIYLMQQGFTFFGRYYYYGSAKNLVGFTLAFGCILAFSKFNLNIGRKKLLYFIIFVFTMYVELMLKSRTSIVCLFLGLILCILFYFKNINTKVTFIILLLVSSFIVLTNDFLYDVVINNIFAAGRDMSDVNELTSGRIEGFELSFELWKTNPIFGVGSNYIDNNILMWLSEHGLFGFILIFTLMILMLLKSLNYKNKKLRVLIIIISIMMIVNGLMESYAPFGPGTKFFCCWMLITGFDYELNDERGGNYEIR